MTKLSCTFKFSLCISFYFAFSQPVLSESCSRRVFDEYELRTQQAYIAYYGRPADPGGLNFWAQRMAQEGGSLESIIQEFGNSQEFNERFGNLNQGELITNIYKQLFNRQPDDAGLAFYSDALSRGEMTLQTITLNVLFGAQGDDVNVFDRKSEVSETFVTRLENEGLNYHDLGFSVLAGVENNQTAEDNCATIATEVIGGGNAAAIDLGTYRIVISGQVTFSGLPASPPFNRSATLVVTPTIDPLDPSLSTNNGVNPVDIGIFTDDSPIIGFAGALYFGTNTSLSSLVGSSIGASAIDVAFVEVDQSAGRVIAAIDGDVFGLPNARLNTFNIFNARDSITTQIQSVLAGTVILEFSDNGNTIAGSITIGGSSGFGGVGITTEYTATFSGTRVQ